MGKARSFGSAFMKGKTTRLGVNNGFSSSPFTAPKPAPCAPDEAREAAAAFLNKIAAAGMRSLTVPPAKRKR